MPPRGLLTVAEVADEHLRLHEQTVRKLIRSGDLPAVRIGRRVLVDPADLAAYIAEHRTLQVELAAS